jgi:tetratricopeptide (TPR) repeat protein
MRNAREEDKVAADRSKAIRLILVGLAVGLVSACAIVSMVWPRLDQAIRMARMEYSSGTNKTKLSTALDYYNAGCRYKGNGWIERSRSCLKRAIELDGPSGPIAERANMFLRTRLPAKQISDAAEQRNIEAFNAAAGGDEKLAKEIWTKMTVDYPDFEWPYGNLASVYLHDGDSVQAERYARKALQINPDYINGINLLAQARYNQKDLDGAERQAALALSKDPHYDQALTLMRIIAGRRSKQAGNRLLQR